MVEWLFDSHFRFHSYLLILQLNRTINVTCTLHVRMDVILEFVINNMT